MRKLDRTKPYGTIHGDLEGRAFTQGDVIFDEFGEEFVAPEPKVAVPAGVDIDAIVAAKVAEALAKLTEESAKKGK